MDIKGNIQSAWSNFVDKLNEQAWFVQLKQKWDELDEQSRLYVKIASLGAAVLFVIILVTSSILSVRELRNNYRDKIALLNMLQNVTDEMRQLKSITATATQQAGVPQPWNAYFESLLPMVGVDKAKLSISSEKPVTTKNTDPSAPKESMFELSLREINVKQLIRLAYQLENGMRPVKLRNMWVDTRGEHSGWLDAKFTVSAFTISAAK